MVDFIVEATLSGKFTPGETHQDYLYPVLFEIKFQHAEMYDVAVDSKVRFESRFNSYSSGTELYIGQWTSVILVGTEEWKCFQGGLACSSSGTYVSLPYLNAMPENVWIDHCRLRFEISGNMLSMSAKNLVDGVEVYGGSISHDSFLDVTYVEKQQDVYLSIPGGGLVEFKLKCERVIPTPPVEDECEGCEACGEGCEGCPGCETGGGGCDGCENCGPGCEGCPGCQTEEGEDEYPLGEDVTWWMYGSLAVSGFLWLSSAGLIFRDIQKQKKEQNAKRMKRKKHAQSYSYYSSFGSKPSY